MKTKHFVIAAIVLPFIIAIALGLVQSGNKTPPIPAGLDVAKEPRAAEPSGREEAETPAEPTESVEPAAAPKPAPAAGNVVRITFAMAGDEEALIDLARRDNAWVLESHDSHPADAARIERFLRDLLEAERVDDPAEPAGESTGTGEGEGVVVVLHDRVDAETEGVAYVVGLSPQNRLGETYVHPTSSDDEYVLFADLRGDMGLWENRPGEKPDAAFWMDAGILKFDPADAVRLEAVYPDHRLSFFLADDKTWMVDGAAPGGEFDRDGFAAWLRDLSMLRVAPDIFDGNNAARFESPDFSLRIALADGSEKTVKAVFDESDATFRIAASDSPAFAYVLPEWRFSLYFERMADVFPKAAPSYAVSDIRSIDCRRSGESVKLMPRDGVWRAIGLPYPVRAEKADALARLLSGWRPRDYADSRTRAARSVYGGPLVEVMLANDTVVQYRLGDKHPVLPRRYVIVDGSVALTAGADEAEAMFPELAQLLDFGKALEHVDKNSIDTLTLTDPDGRRSLAFHRKDGGWTVETETGESAAIAPDSAEIILEPTSWDIDGFHAEAETLFAQGGGAYALTLAGDGKTRGITFLPPAESASLALIDGERPVLLNGGAVKQWLEAMRALAPAPLVEAPSQDAVPVSEEPELVDAPDAPALEDARPEDREDMAEPAATADPVPAPDAGESLRPPEPAEKAEAEQIPDSAASQTPGTDIPEPASVSATEPVPETEDVPLPEPEDDVPENEEEETAILEEEENQPTPETHAEEAAALVRSEIESITRADEEEQERSAEEIRVETGAPVIVDELIEAEAEQKAADIQDGPHSAEPEEPKGEAPAEAEAENEHDSEQDGGAPPADAGPEEETVSIEPASSAVAGKLSDEDN